MECNSKGYTPFFFLQFSIEIDKIYTLLEHLFEAMLL